MNIYLVVDTTLEGELVPRLNAVKGANVVGVARDTAEALAHIKRARPHLVIVAVDPSDGSGIDALSGLEDDKEDRPLVYAVSNRWCEKTRARCTRAGVSRYFEKPQITVLVDAVTTLASIC